jgi:hypothetical protein
MDWENGVQGCGYHRDQWTPASLPSELVRKADHSRPCALKLEVSGAELPLVSVSHGVALH